MAISTTQVAANANIKADSISSLIARGVVIPHPDRYVGSTAIWHIDTITEWLEHRPDKGSHWKDTLPKGKSEVVNTILKDYPTANQAGKLLNTAPRNIQDRAKRGTLPTPVARPGNSWIWKKSNFDLYLPE